MKLETACLREYLMNGCPLVYPHAWVKYIARQRARPFSAFFELKKQFGNQCKYTNYQTTSTDFLVFGDAKYPQRREVGLFV